MRKIITLFQRNHDGDRQVRNEITPGAEWVVAGEGIATKKYDGTCCRILNGILWKRYEVKAGGTPPERFEAADEVDPVTGKQQGWVLVTSGPEDKWHRQALGEDSFDDGIYELVGPKIQGNPEKYRVHTLVSLQTNNVAVSPAPPRDFDGLKEYLRAYDIEGIVWHHPDGRMVKIKAKDFGIKRGGQ